MSNTVTGHMNGCPATVGGACICYQPSRPAPTEMTSLLEIKQRLISLEHGQRTIEKILAVDIQELKKCLESLETTIVHWASETKEVGQRLAAIEQGQSVLCERLDSLASSQAGLAAIIQNGQMQVHQQMENLASQLEDVHVVNCQPRPARKPKRRKR